MYMYMYMHVYVYVHVYVSMYMSMSHAYVYVYVYVCVCVYVYMCAPPHCTWTLGGRSKPEADECTKDGTGSVRRKGIHVMEWEERDASHG